MSGSSRRSRRRAWADVNRRSRGRHAKGWSSGRPSPWRARAIAALVVVGILAVVAGGITARVETMGRPAPVYHLTATFPSSVPGTPPHVAMPAGGEADLTTTGGATLGSHQASVPQAIASLTKVMTAYVVLHDHPLAPGQAGPSITVTPVEAASVPRREAEGQSLLPVTAGEHLSELQALEALLVPSADNIADVLATWDAGSIPAFVSKMDATAHSLGMGQTSYTDASGYAPGSTSDAADQLTLWRHATADPVFARIVSDRFVTLPEVGKVANYDTLVGTHGIVGGKTGSTSAAGGCLVWTARHQVDGRTVTVLGAVLGQRQTTYIAAALASAVRLTNEAFGAFSLHTLVPAGTSVYRVSAGGRSTTAVTSAALTTVALPGSAVHVHATPSAVMATGADGAVSVPVRLAAPLKPPTLTWKLRHLFG